MELMRKIVHRSMLALLVLSAIGSHAINPARADNSLVQPDVFPDKTESTENYDSLFRQAVTEDLAGEHTSARFKYNILSTTILASVSAVPSAINLVAIGKYNEALQAFKVLQLEGNERDCEYAQLWELWITARTWTDNTINLQKMLRDKTREYQWHLKYEEAISGLYTGNNNEEDIFRIINETKFQQAEGASDAVTQAVFFIGGYYHYVVKDTKKTRDIYERYLPVLNKTSLERTLIISELQRLEKTE